MSTHFRICTILSVSSVCGLLLSCRLFGQSASAPPQAAKNPVGARVRQVEKYDSSVPTPTHALVRYGDHERHVLDFWQAESDKPAPLVFIIHGGGWQGGSKERANRFANVAELLKAGISVTSLNYRYVKQAVEQRVSPPVKAPLYDAARALQFVRSMAEEWNLDKERIGAAGGSAGACSSLWIAYHDDLADSDSVDPVSRESTRLWCAAVTGAQTTLDPQQMKQWTPNSRYGGHAFGLPNFNAFLAGRVRFFRGSLNTLHMRLSAKTTLQSIFSIRLHRRLASLRKTRLIPQTSD